MPLGISKEQFVQDYEGGLYSTDRMKVDAFKEGTKQLLNLHDGLRQSIREMYNEPRIVDCMTGEERELVYNVEAICVRIHAVFFGEE